MCWKRFDAWISIVTSSSSAGIRERLVWARLSVFSLQWLSCIAMAVLHRPSVLIADEPTSALDPIAASEVIALLRRLNRELGMSVIYISHDLTSVAQLCERLLILESGCVIEEGTTEQVFSSPRTEYMRKLVSVLQVAGSSLSPAV
jgi:ABC-type glutathione transport system ATPase component